MKILLIHQQHLAKLNTERVCRFRERKRQDATNEYISKVHCKFENDL
jgi:hypothetical protein